MTTWADLAAAEPRFAEAIEGRFSANLHHVLGTLDAHGAPRLSGLEVPIHGGHVWMGMMPNSVKRGDLDRDPRFSLHSAPLDEKMVDGDAKISGVAVLVPPGDARRAAFWAGTRFDDPGDTDDAAIWWADLVRVTLSKVVGEVMVVQTWTPSDGLRTIETG